MQLLSNGMSNGSNESKFFEEKENLYKKKKKYFNHSIRKKMKSFVKKVLFPIIMLVLIIYIIVIGMSPNFKETRIYDEYNELEDKELYYILKKEIKDLTISRNVYISFAIVYKDVYFKEFFEDKIVIPSNSITILYNPMDETLDLISDLDYLVEDYKCENVKDVKKELPKYFSMIEGKLEKNVCFFDYYTLTFNHLEISKDLLLALLVGVLVAIGFIDLFVL